MDLSSSKKWRCDPLGVLSVASLYESDAGVEREPKTLKIKRSVEGINISRMRRVSRGLAFLGLYAIGFKKKMIILGGGGILLKKNLYICG